MEFSYSQTEKFEMEKLSSDTGYFKKPVKINRVLLCPPKKSLDSKSGPVGKKKRFVDSNISKSSIHHLQKCNYHHKTIVVFGSYTYLSNPKTCGLLGQLNTRWMESVHFGENVVKLLGQQTVSHKNAGT